MLMKITSNDRGQFSLQVGLSPFSRKAVRNAQSNKKKTEKYLG